MDEPFRKDFGLLVEFSRAADTNHRTLAIICVSYAEKYLGELIQWRMKGLNYDLREKLFNPSGLLGPLAARIDIAKAINLIDDTAFSDLKLLASIRNKFAHNLEIASFDHPEIAKRLLKLHLRPELIQVPEDAEDWFPAQLAKWTNEERFRYAAMTLCSTMHNGMHTLGQVRPHRAKD